MARPAVFLDKDGTVIEDIPYNVAPGKIRFMPGVPEGLRAISAAGFPIFIATNQSGVARGYCTEEELQAVGRHLAGMMEGIGARLDGFYYCPHLPGGTVPGYARPCGCRKPEPGLVVRAAREHDLDVFNSWFVGDILNDIEAGRRAGCRTVLVDTGKETEWILSRLRLPHHIVSNFGEAARVITALGQRLRADCVSALYL